MNWRRAINKIEAWEKPERTTNREWKKEALGYLIFIKNHPNNRHDNEYAGYLKRFFFGDGELTFDGNNETWKKRKEKAELPMPRNIYLKG